MKNLKRFLVSTLVLLLGLDLYTRKVSFNNKDSDIFLPLARKQAEPFMKKNFNTFNNKGQISSNLLP